MSAELLATYSGLGTQDGDNYYPGEDCLACVKDLIRGLRNDDPLCSVRRQLGSAKTLSMDLLPLLEQCGESDGVLQSDLIRLLVNLTQPTYLCFGSEYPLLQGKEKKDPETVKSFMEVDHYLRDYKDAFTRPAVMNVLGATLAHHCQKDWESRDDDDTVMIERVLLLIRNILHIPPDQTEERGQGTNRGSVALVGISNQRMEVHADTWNIHMNGIDELLVFLASNEEEHHWCMHVLEIVFLMLREQDPKVLTAVGRSKSKEEKERDDRLLEDLLKGEERRKKKAVKCLGSRHSRFGGTFMAPMTTSISHNPQVYHKPLSNIHNYSYDSGKTARRKPVTRRAVCNPPKKRFSTYSIRLALKDFCVQFLECCYNPIMRVAKDNIQHQRAMENDDTYYLWAVRFFMEFSRKHDFRVEVVGETLTMQTVHYVIQLIGTRYENMSMEKKATEAKRHSERLHYAIQTYQEILEYIKAMAHSKDTDLQDNAKIMQHNVFYHAEYRDLFITLLRNYNPKHSSRDLLKDMVQTLHNYLSLLEKFNRRRGCMVVQGKRKKKTAKKSVPKSATASTQWAEIQGTLLDALQQDQEDLSSVSGNSLQEAERAEVMQDVTAKLSKGNYAQAVATTRAAREVWPNDSFGHPGMSPEEELETLHVMFMKIQGPKEVVDDMDRDQGEEVEGEGEIEDETAIESYELEFDIKKFLHRFSGNKILQKYCYLLSFHASNSDHTNHCIAKMLHRMAVDLNLAPLLYQVSLFKTFHEILSSHSTRYKELQSFAKYVVSGFFSMAQSNPMMFVELLFWRTPADCIELTEGYGTLQAKRNRLVTRHIWTREDESELSDLFEQYKDDSDIVGCIQAALANQDRTRRGIASQLVKMGLVGSTVELKKRRPTKGTRRPRWTQEDDDRLRTLYSENEPFIQDGGELDFDAFAQSFEGKSAGDLEHRMAVLGLIPKSRKRRKKPASNASQGESEEGEGTDQEQEDTAVPHSRTTEGSKSAQLIRRLNADKPRVKKATKLNCKQAARLVAELVNKDMSDAVVWLMEYLQDEAKDREEDDNSADLCIVPVGEDLCRMLRTSECESLMSALGLQPPDDTEMYWRIPGYLSAADLKDVTTVLSEQLASGAPPLEEEGVGLQEDSAGMEDCTEQVTPASPTLDPEPDSNLDDMEVLDEGKSVLSTDDHQQKLTKEEEEEEEEEEEQQGTAAKSCASRAAFHAPKKRAIAWSDSEDSEAEEQSVDRVTAHTGSMAMDSDRCERPSAKKKIAVLWSDDED